MPFRDGDQRAVVRRLAEAGCVAPNEEAAALLGAAADHATLERFVARREQGEPLPWITGSVVFCGHVLRIRPGVYVPRRRSEALATRAVGRLPRGGVAVDLCTGGGALAAVLQRAVGDATVIGIDCDPHAVACARDNGVRAVVGDLAAPLRPGRWVDVVTVVAPYVPTDEVAFLPADVQRYEPRTALDGGPDGLALVRRAIAAAAGLLRPGGWLFLEVGGHQDRLLAAPLSRSFTAVEQWHDDDGDLRGVAAQAD